jgi:succinylarginine dihydrolase
MTTSKPATTREFNFDGIVGPTHNYSGLSYGNIASTSHKNVPSHPRAAALQGLENEAARALGIGQAFLPPPAVRASVSCDTWASTGPTPSHRKAAAADATLVAIAFSASNMWPPTPPPFLPARIVAMVACT